MVTGASTADLALVLIDAAKGCSSNRAGMRTWQRCSGFGTWWRA